LINFKENILREEWIKLDPRVRKITYLMNAIMDLLYGVNVTVTSVYRLDVHSTHHYYRAADIRSRDIKEEECVYLSALINIIFPYGKGAHETVMYHDVGEGAHFHVQVKVRSEEKKRIS